MWAGQCPFGGCDAARRPLRGQPGCSWAPPSQPVHRVEASYTSAEPVCGAWALQHAPQAAESPELVVNPSEAPLRSDRRGRCAVRHHQLGRALPARAWRDIRHPRTRNGARQTHHQRSPVSAGSCWPAWRAHGGNPSPQARLCRPVDAQGQVLVASTEHGGRSKWFLRGPGGRAPWESYTRLPHFAPRHLLLGKSAARPPRLQPRWQPVLRGREAAARGCAAWAGQCPFGGCDAARRPLRGQPGCSLQLGTSQPACSQGRSLLHECRTSLRRLGAPARPTSRRVSRVCRQSKRGAAQKRLPRPVCGPASSAGQGAAGAGTEGRQAPQNTQWRAPDSPSTQPCLRRKLLASLARAWRHPEPSGSPVQACGRPGPGAGRQHGTWGSQQMVLAGTWGARPLGKLHPPTPFCTPPLTPGQERSTSTAAPATLAACAARQGGCCERLRGVGRSVPNRGLRCSSPAPARAAGLQLGTSQPACSQGRSLLHECRTSLRRLGAPARPTSRRVSRACRQSKRGAAQKRSPRPVCGPASSAGQGVAGDGTERHQPPQNTQWRAPDSPSTQPCLRRKLLASLARARRHPEPSGSPVQACGRPGPGAGRQHGTWGSQQMVLAGTWGARPAGKLHPPQAYPMLHPATCSWARAQHVHRGSSHAGSLCCEAGRLLREAARCGPVSARSGAAMQLAGPCGGSRAAAGHLPASLFTGSKPPTQVPNQSAALGRSSTPHKPQSRQSLPSIQARRRSEAIAAAGVRSGIISWAGRCWRWHGATPATPEHAMARARLTINAALSPQEAAGQPGARTEASRALRLACAGLWTPMTRCWSPARNMGVAANGSCGHLGGPQESYTRLPHVAPRHSLLGKSAARPPRLQPRWQPVLRGREAAAGGCTVWAGQCPFGGCDAARRPLRGQPGCSWAPPSQPVHRVEASYTSAEPVCGAWALQHAPQAAESPELVVNPSEAPLRSDRRGRCAVRHHQLGRALPARARRDARHPRTRNGARQTHHQSSPVSAGSCWPAWRAHGGNPSPQACLCRPVDAQGQVLVASTEHGVRSKWFLRGPGGRAPWESYTRLRPTPFCTPPLTPGQELSTSTAAPATLAACAARQGGCCERLRGVGRSVPVRGLRCSSPAPARAAGLQLGTSQPACSQGRSLLHECRTSLQRLGAPARPTSRRVARACRQSERGAAQKRSPRLVCGPASSAGQGVAGDGTERHQPPQNTQWRAPDSPSTQPCLRRKLLASLARARRHPEPSGSPVQACGRLGPGAGRQHGTWGSQQMLLADTWAAPRKVTPAYPMLHPATCSWARAQHVHRGSSHAGSLCCEAGRLLQEAAQCGPVSARSGAAMQLAGPCAGSRAAAGHLPASLFTGSKPPTRVPNQSAALGRSSTPHKSQSRHSLSSIQARRRSEAIAAAGVRSGIISWAARCRRGRGGISGTPEHAMARARLTINAALSPQEAAGQPGARRQPEPSGSLVQACGRPGPGAGRQHGTWGSQQMVLAGTWGARPPGKLHPSTPFCTPPLAPGQERSTSTAAPATLAACAARQGGCCRRLHGVGRSVPVRGLRCSSPAPARAAGLQLGTSQPACSQGRSLLHECRTSLQRLGAPARLTSCRVARACVQSKRGAAQKRSPRPVCGPASSAGQGAASAGTEGRQAPQNTQWRAPDSPSTQPCLRRKLLASLARARRHLEPSGSPVQACGRLGPGAGRQHGTLGSQQMVLAGFWGARPPGKLHPPTPFCTPPLAPGQERSTSTAAPATLAACAARQGGCCRRLHGVGRSVPVRGLRCSSPAPARAAGLQLGTSQPACSQGRSLLHECRTSLQRLGAPARPTSRRVATACRQSKRGAAQKRSPRPVCGPASSAGQGAAGAGVEGYQAPQNTQWRAPDSPLTQPCLRRKLLASLARARRQPEPSGSLVQACGRPGPGAGRQHGTWGSQQMVLAGTWGARPPGKLHPSTPFCTPPLAPGQERSTSTAAPATLAACAARQGGCCRRLHGVGRSVPVRGLRCSSPAPARAAGLQLGTSQPAFSQGRSLLHECRTSLQRLGAPARPTSCRVARACVQSKRGSMHQRPPMPQVLPLDIGSASPSRACKVLCMPWILLALPSPGYEAASNCPTCIGCHASCCTDHALIMLAAGIGTGGTRKFGLGLVIIAASSPGSMRLPRTVSLRPHPRDAGWAWPPPPAARGGLMHRQTPCPRCCPWRCAKL